MLIACNNLILKIKLNNLESNLTRISQAFSDKNLVILFVQNAHIFY